MVQACLIGLIASLGVFGDQLGSLYINRPIILAPLVGLVLGDLHQGLIIGASLELFFMGAVSIGAYVPPDTIVGGVLATAFAISMGKGIETAVTLAMPIALVSQAIGNFCNVFNSVILRFTDRYAVEGKYSGVVTTHWLIGMINIVRRFLLVFFAFYLGSEAVGNMINAIPAYVTDGMAAAAGLLPALGFAMLMRMTVNKQNVPYYFLGFALAAYMSVPVLGVAILGVILIVVKFDFMNLKGAAAGEAGVEVSDDDDF